MTVFGAWRFGVAACALLLASCGGGGGGADPSVSVTGDKTSFQFLGFVGDAQQPQSITFTLTNGSSTYYGDVVSDQPASFQASFTPTGSAGAVVTLTPIAPPPGARSGAVTFRLCADSKCTRVAWSQSIPYTMTVFSVDKAALVISGYEGAASPSRGIVVSPPDSTHALSVSTSTTTGSGWLSATRGADSTINVVASGAGRPAGSYQGTVTVSFAGQPNGPSVAVPVSFTVGAGIVAPAARSIDLTADATSTSLAGSAPIAFNGNQSPAWSVSSDQPWLVPTTAAGTGAGALQYTVDTAKLAGIANWSAGTAQLKISATGMSDVTVPITLNKKLPEVYTVSANTVVAGQASTVRVFGRGLSQLSSASRILVDGAASATGTVTSDTTAVLSLPALAAGRVALSVVNAAGLPTSGGALAVMNLSALSYATAANAGEKRSAMFDPSRNAVYAVNRTQNTLVRFRLVGSQWQVDGLPVASIGDIAMAPDRQTLYVGSGADRLQAIDPDALQVKATHVLGSSLSNSLAVSRSSTKGMAVTNNLKIWFGTSQWSTMGYFDILHASFGKQALPPRASGLLYSPSFYAAGDGSRMLVAQAVLSPPEPNYTYASATDAVSAPAGVPLVYGSAVLNEDGSKVLIDNRSLFDTSNFSLLGQVQAASGTFVTNTVISPDGQRIYALVRGSSNSRVIDRVDIYDTTQIQPGTSALVKLGQIAVTDQALDCGATAASGCDVNGAFVISPLGDTLFWVGNQRLVVIPIPSGMLAIAPAQNGLQRATTPQSPSAQ